ncbi:MAG TPA: methyltransferase domain-containing protein [Ktedonobacteraceae bacterium]|nr:methyltransferase domain-containing protein [Ktedonobacteraceae bacterium]
MKQLQQAFVYSVAEKLAIDESAYDSIADWYDHNLSASWLHTVTIPAMLRLLQEVEGIEGRRILDVGCGQGILTRELAARNALVTGVDLSRNLLKIARQKELRAPLGISYIHDDAHSLEQLGGQRFDVITCNLALLDIRDLPRLIESAKRLLVTGGWWVNSLLHPCGPHTDAEGALTYRDYYAEGYWRSPNSKSVRGQVGSYHRRLETYIEGFLKSGLVIDAFREPKVNTLLAPVQYQRVPAVALFRLRKI